MCCRFRLKTSLQRSLRYPSIDALYSSHTRFRALPISTYTSNRIRPLASSTSL
nr:MAG TPA: hypothetical protein [Caudoviricetes sp.]